MAKTTFIAAGDAFAIKRLPKGGYEGFDEVQACVKAHDVAFLNLESTFHDREGIPLLGRICSPRRRYGADGQAD